MSIPLMHKSHINYSLSLFHSLTSIPVIFNNLTFPLSLSFSVSIYLDKGKEGEKATIYT